MNVKIAILIFVIEIVNLCPAYLRCGQKDKTTPTYHLIRPCTNSKMARLASANLFSINSCMIFARKNNGLAFSFLPGGTVKLEDNEEEEDTCVVFECPEFESTLTQQTSAYHYYSLYAQPIPNVNVSCIPGVGVFMVNHQEVNYTQAKAMCKETGGQLANVLSDQRTKLLSDLLLNLRERKQNVQAYVGLDDTEIEGTFMSSNGHLLQCSLYRAWAPGHPHQKKDSQDCVVLTTKEMWKVVDCVKMLPFICEILPAGPFQLCSNMTIHAKRECLANHINRTEIMKENSKCVLPDSYETTATKMLAEINYNSNKTVTNDTAEENHESQQ